MAFGTDRFARTAYLCRTGTHALPALSFAVTDHAMLVGSLQCWPVALAADHGIRVPMVMVGPVAVAPAAQRTGIGRMLMQALMDSAENAAHGALMMIGDPEYYERFFGFSAAATAHWRVPGPFDPRRLLARAVAGHAVPTGPGVIMPDTAHAYRVPPGG